MSFTWSCAADAACYSVNRVAVCRQSTAPKVDLCHASHSQYTLARISGPGRQQMDKQRTPQTPEPTAKVAADSRELAMSEIQAALLEQQSSLEKVSGFDPYNCRQGSNRADVWGSRRR